MLGISAFSSLGRVLLIDLLVGGFALLVLLLTGFAVWQHVKGLTASVRNASERVSAASARVGEASAGLEAPRR